MRAILEGKCPKCEKGDIFKSAGNIFTLRAPIMHSHCENCGYRFEKEPGYFIGAMYVSYGLALIEVGIVFLALFWIASFNILLIAILLTLILGSFFNFRFARIFWIWIFQK